MSTKNNSRTNEKKILDELALLNERLDELKERDSKIMKVMERFYVFVCKIDDALAAANGVKKMDDSDEGVSN